MNIQPCVFIVEDDPAVRDVLALVLETADIAYQLFESAECFLQAYCPGYRGCLLLDVNLPGLNGLELQSELKRHNINLPIIFLTGNGTIPMTVRAIQSGAADFLTKPVPSKLLLERIKAVLHQESQLHEQTLAKEVFHKRLESLTSREQEILPLALAGHPNKEIARQLGISYRTVETHRIRILQKTETTNFLELSQLCEAFSLTSEPKP